MSHICHKHYLLKFFTVILTAVAATSLDGCTGISIATPATIAQTTKGSITVVAQSAPSKTTSVQSLRLQVTSALLNPGNVQLVATPVTVDLANITTGSAFLSTATAPVGLYSSLTITFSNPSLSITNTTGNPIAIPGGTCAVQSTCTFVPPVTTSQSTVTTGALPLTVIAGKATSFALTLSMSKILQSNDSLDFSTGVDTGLDQAGTSGSPTTSGNEPLDAEIGVVQSVANGQLVLVSESNDVSPSITIDSDTSFNFPSPICAANNTSCIAAGEVVVAALSLTSAGTLHADSIAFADAANAKLLQGTVVAISPSSSSFQILVNKSFGFTTDPSPDDSTATITLEAGTVFGISSVAYPTVSGTSFSSLNSMVVGQTVLVDVAASSFLPNASSAQVFLTDSTASGTISALSNSETFTLTNYPAEQDNSSPITSMTTVQTGIGTLYRNLTPASYSSLINGQSVSVTGPLFNTSPTPTLASDQISLHASTDQ